MKISNWLIWTKDSYGWYWIGGVITFFSVIIGSFFWMFQYISTLTAMPNQSQVVSPIDIAGVTATLGGLLLIGAFGMGKKESPSERDKEITGDLKRIGKFILVTSASMIVSYFMSEYVRLMKESPLTTFDHVFVDVAAAFIAIGIIFISCALSSLITMVRYL